MSPSFMLGGQLGRSSERQSELRREETLLRAEAGPEAPSRTGVRGCERLGVSVDLGNGEMGRDRSSSKWRRPLELEGRLLAGSLFLSKSWCDGTRGLGCSGVSVGGTDLWSFDRGWAAGGGWDDEPMADSSPRT
jgi:hypothetical protein